MFLPNRIKIDRKKILTFLSKFFIFSENGQKPITNYHLFVGFVKNELKAKYIVTHCFKQVVENKIKSTYFSSL